ncbi:hypothetical protein N8865_00795 [Francisellaceae bacterium]|nr:hypothetical protein [Francisellaceae bacterium]
MSLTFIKKSLFIGVSVALLANSAAYSESLLKTGEPTKVANLLMGKLTGEFDGEYTTVKGKLGNSYVYDNSFFKNFVCGSYAEEKDYSCDVTDYERNEPWSLIGEFPEKTGAKIQVEREDVKYGQNIYDLSTWQIGLALAYKHKLYKDGNDQDALLKAIQNEDDRLLKPDARAATKDDGMFTYGGVYSADDVLSGETNFKEPLSAYSFRMLSPSFMVEDPFCEGKIGNECSYTTTGGKAVKITWSMEDKGDLYKVGEANYRKNSWTDFKPISGENGWAFLIGALQALDLTTAEGTNVAFNSVALQNALQLLPALKAMQSPIGGFYYAANGSLDNFGNAGTVAGDISNENNVSIWGGLNIMHALLGRVKTSTDGQKEIIKKAKNMIDGMIYGYPDQPGLISYFEKYGAHGKGTESDPILLSQGGKLKGGKFTTNTAHWAVDANTWGLDAFGAKFTQTVLESKYAEEGQTLNEEQKYKLLFNLLNHTFSEGGYWKDNKLWGVGYTNQNIEGANKVLSGEWTLGAIMATQILIEHYEAETTTHPEWKKVVVDQLKAWELSMTTHIRYLLTSEYASKHTQFCSSEADCVKDGVPTEGELAVLPDDQLGMLYASRRYTIPFGWFANPLPSMASTTWMLMVQYGYNPFAPKGKLNPEIFVGKKLDFDPSISFTPKDSFKVVNGFAAEDQNIAMSYEKEGSDDFTPVKFSDNNMHLAIGQTGYVKGDAIPSDVNEIKFAYQAGEKSWYGACVIKASEWDADKAKLLSDPANYFIKVIWTNDAGDGNCKMEGFAK